jgi:serine/threonine protein kinase
MNKKPIFGLKPGQLNRLLSVGIEEANSTNATAEEFGGYIGHYKLLNVLGEGGMGVVYLAEQQRPVRRQVAIKIVKPGMDSRQIIARFEAERQALAILDHPNIAHVLEAGATENSRPYFVMEYVKGMPITEHCDSHKLTIEDRLNLFLQVCQAVHHAHQKGIIHRDIKPSNILVSIQGDQTVPKIIDFGVAKAINQPLTERTFFTEQGQLFGTPEYMSPEQADMANEDIDTRSDIYSLGVLLYVLLAGTLPFDSDTFRQGGFEHIRRAIRETEPKPPSTRLKSLGQEARKIAESRRTEPAILTKCLHKELEWIPLKAMRKERSERYRSASELADDIENYLQGNPLIAGPESIVYQLRKLVRRHQAFVTGIAAILIVLIAGVMGIAMFAIKAEQRRAEAQAVSDFLRHSVLASLDPFQVGGREITVRSVLDAASKSLVENFEGTPLAKAKIQDTLGFAYWSLGLYEQAELHRRGALDVYRSRLGPDHPTTLACIDNLGGVYFYQSRYREAEQLRAKALRGMQRVLGEDHESALHCMWSLASVYCMLGRFREAEELSVKVLEVFRRQYGEEDTRTVNKMSLVAWVYHLQGRYEETERLSRRALGISRRLRGEKDYWTLTLKHLLGAVQCDLGRYEEAEQLLLETLDGRRQGWSPEHPDTLGTIVTLGWLYYSQGGYEQAESRFNEVLESSVRNLSEEHEIRLNAMHGLGTVYLSQGRYDEAESSLDKARKMKCRLLGEENWSALSVKNTVARLYTAQSRYDGAEHLFHEVLKGRQRELGEDHPDTLETKNDLALLYKEQARYDEAEPLLIEALEGRRVKLGDTHPHTIESWNDLIKLYEAWGKPEKASEWRAELAQIEDIEE